MNTFFKNWSLLSFSSVVQQIASFFCMIRIARLLAPEGFGNYILILTAVAITPVVAVLGLPQIITRQVARHASIVNIVRQISLPLIAMTILTNIGLALYFSFFSSLSELTVILAAVVISMSQIIWVILESFAFGKQQMEFSSILGSASSIIWLLFVYTIPRDSFSLVLIICGFSIIQLFRGITYGVLEWRSGYFIRNINLKEIKDNKDKKSIFLQSLPMYGTNFSSLFATQIPIIFLGHLSGTEEVGYYGIGNKLMMPLMLLSNMLIASVYPILSKYFIDNRIQFNLITRKLFFAISLFGIIFGLTIGIFSKEIIVLIFGNNFLPAVEPFFIQIWAVLILIILSLIATLFLATNNENLMVKLSAFNGLFIGLCSYIGAHYGAIGLAIGSIVSFAVGFLFHWKYLNIVLGKIFQPFFLISIASPFLLLIVGGFLFLHSSLPLRLIIIIVTLTSVSIFHKKTFAELYRDLKKYSN